MEASASAPVMKYRSESGLQCLQIPQGVFGVGEPAAVDVDAADREARVGRGGDHRHQIAVFAGADLAAFQPGLTSRHEHHLVELEQISDLAGRDQVPVVDGIERPTHDSQSPLLHGLPAYLRFVVRFRPRQTGSSWSITDASCLAERHSCMVMTS